MWHVYLLECADNTLYCGITTNLERRLAEHNGLLSGGAKCTRARRPVCLVAAVARSTRSEAMQLEYKIKSTPRSQKIALLKSFA